ncbi:t1pks [Epichloe bromicola]|uniref:T1pks n=1 Tax=Epichloe bromicola TaxID=79588 RepID=A0ABQ0CZ09_9HYPO
MAPHQTSAPNGTTSPEAGIPRYTYRPASSTPDSPWVHRADGPELAKPMAIIGMAMRLPGSVHSGDDLWDLLSKRKSGLCDIPKNRFNADGFYDPARGPGTIPVKKGYFLPDVEIEEFDTNVFPIPKMELERLDPAQRQLLQVAYECMESAGGTSWRGSRTGCYIGEFGEDFADSVARESQQRGNLRYTGLADFAIANRVSYELDLQGPSMVVKTACSSSLVCLDLACKAIQSGECDSALVGGVSLLFSPATFISVTDLGVISPNGQCRSFDAGADGYARGEAVNMVMIKRLDHALRDKDPIRAVIRGTGVNTDGRTNGMLTPSSTVQADLIRHTYEVAGIDDLSQTAVVECHGTGTPVGDPIETEAVGRCFGEEGVVITSVIIESTAQFGIKKPVNSITSLGINTNGDFVSNCNGFRKQNGHEHDQHQGQGVCVNGDHANGTIVNGVNGNGEHANREANLLVFSAHSSESLDRQITACRDFAATHQSTSLKDLAYTLSSRRDHRPYRAYAIADDASGVQEASATVHDVVDEAPPPVGWIFTGQGAQWPEMGAKLIDTNDVFRRRIRKLDKYLQTLTLEPPVSIEAELRKTKEDSRVHRPEMGHLVCVALQVALVDILRSWNIVPDFVLGHSSGETAAAYACGAITAEAAVYAATRRGIGNASSQRKGSMAAVGLGRDEIQPFMLEGVNIACENSQSNVTLSGDTEQVESIVATLKAERPEVFARLLRVEKAYHSHHMHDYGPVYEEQLKSVVRSANPKIPFYSSVTGDLLTGEGQLGASYWRANMENTVLFNPALRCALRDRPGKMVLIELGPHPALEGPVGQILRDLGRTDDLYLGTCTRSKECDTSLLHLAGKLYQRSIPMDFAVICSPGAVLTNLPRYAWKQDTTHWAESRVSRGWRLREHPPHELLGSRVLETEGEPCWRKVMALEDALWLDGHEVNGQVVFPAAGYISMVGEALRQLTDNTTFTVRNVRIMSGLVLSSEKPVELVTLLSSANLGTSDDSEWYEFTITSFDGTAWARNCHGEAMASTDKSFHLDSVSPAGEPFPRKLDRRDSYDILRRVGFSYTGEFESMVDISVSPSSFQAHGISSLGRQVTDKPSRCATYSLHPAVMDQCFQLFTVALCRGLRRSNRRIAVPTFIEELVVSPSALPLSVTAKLSRIDEVGSWTGDFVAVPVGAQGSEPVVRLKGMKSVVLASPAQSEPHLSSDLEWKPHSDFVGLGVGLHPRVPRKTEWALLEELILLCNLDHLDQIKTDGATAPYLIKLLDWMRLVTDRYKSGKNLFVPADTGLEQLDHDERVARIDGLMAQLADTQDIVFARAIHRLFVEAPSIFTGEGHPLHILMPDNVLSDFYDATSFDMADAVRLVANTNPHMRVLEVGAGTGSMTARLLRALTSSHGERLYSQYGYTDVSAGFMAVGKQRFAAVENIDYDVLDISQDPEEQGFKPGSYDLVIASNVLHATPTLDETLRNVYSLLKPSGRLFLEELTPVFSKGFFHGWWLGAEDNRVEQPWIAPESWAEKLVTVGFQKPEAILLDCEKPYQISAGIIASRGSRSTLPSKVAILCHTTDEPLAIEIISRLGFMGIDVETCLWGQPLPSCDIISVLELEKPLLHEMSEETFKTIIAYFQSHKARVIWVTEACQIGCTNPEPAMMLGLARTVRNEYSLQMYTVELDKKTTKSRATEAIIDIWGRVSTPDLDPESMDHDYEYALVEGRILIPRFHWQTMSGAFSGAAHNESNDGDFALKQLNMSTPGLLRTMKWIDGGDATAPAEGEVLVEVKAVGLNFRDIILALGVVEGNPSGMGHEASGVIRAVGPDVQDLSVGDRVMFIHDGCFTTQLRLSKDICVKLDDSASFVQGAALPAVYATALSALIDISKLQRGQSVLIHAACGGVGLAAIQIAQNIGAKIYCTVGSEPKRRYLEDTYNIPADHIFNSRDVTFLPEVMRATNGRGVDVVLNSLSGDLLHASWKCVAEFGVMVEIGKRDFQRRSKLAMEIFEANRSFVGLDIRGLSISRPVRASDLMRRCVDMIGSGAIQGPVACTTFPAVEIQDAYRYMQSAKHIGKIVIEMPEDPRELGTPAPSEGGESTELEVSPRRKPSFRPDRSYLLVGGLGGLGRAVATWMVEHGARVLVFLSRSARENDDNKDFLNDLRAEGCTLLLVPGSVSILEDVQRAVAIATADQPLGGLINLSMVLRDVTLNKMTYGDWTTAVEPKVRGTWNLHHATATCTTLEFFILFSSQNAQIGQWGQANYAAANTFLDAFAQYRHGHNLVSSVIDVGLMGDVGFAAENRAILKKLGRIGMYILQETDLLDAIHLALLKSQPVNDETENKTSRYLTQGYVGIGLNTTTPMSAASTRVPWKRDPRMSIYHNMDSSSGDVSGEGSFKGGSLKVILAAESSEEKKVEIIARALANTLGNFLIKDGSSFPLDKPLKLLAMDSLIAMEVRNWIRQNIGAETSTFTVLQSSSFTHLAGEVKTAMNAASEE